MVSGRGLVGPPLPLLVLVVALWPAVVPATEPSCLVTTIADGFGGEFTISGGDYDPTTYPTPLTCAATCGRIGLPFFALETISDSPSIEVACLCGESDQVPTSAGTCDTCSGGICGGLDGNLWLGSTSQEITLVELTVRSNNLPSIDTDVSVEATSDVADTVFSLSAGDGSVPVTVNGVNGAGESTGSTMTYSLRYFAPGTYDISVAARMIGCQKEVIATANVTILAAVDLVQVTCPTAAEPAAPYYCGAVVTGSNAEVEQAEPHVSTKTPITVLSPSSLSFFIEITASFDDDGAQTTIPAPDFEWTHLGLAPPQGPSTTTNMVANTTSFMLSTSFTMPTVILRVRAFGLSETTCKVKLVTPVCSGDDVLCPGSGVCTSSCPWTGEDQEYQCNNGILCPLMGTCASGLVDASDCSGGGQPATSYAAVGSFSITVSENTHTDAVPATEMIAQPGDMIQVVCSGPGIAATAAVGPSDLDLAATRLGVRHLFQVIGTRKMSISVVHQCSRPVVPVVFQASVSTGESMTSVTACEYIVRNLTIALEQAGLSKDTSVKVYLDASLPVIVKVQIAEGAPVNISWAYGTSDLPNDTLILNERVDPAAYYDKTVTYPAVGTFTINASAVNLHSEELGATWAMQEVHLQHPVLSNWMVEMISSAILVEPTSKPPVEAVVIIHVKLPSSLLLPTDAFLFAHFGDQFPMAGFEPLSDYGASDGTSVDGFYIFTLTHQYATAGLYSVTVHLKNEVSNITLNTEVDVQEKIIDFGVQLKFQLVETTTELEEGLGDDKNKFHNDKNISFVMSMTQGTVTEYMLYNMSNGEEELLTTFAVEDKLNPLEGNFVAYFSVNQALNLTLKARNDYEVSEPVWTTIWIVDPITPIEGVQLLEGPEVTSRGMEKLINVTFMAASIMQMCMVVDYGDGSPLAAYGDERQCSQNYSQAAFQPNDLTTPMELKHTYWRDGAYNISVLIYNPVSMSNSQLTFLVTQFPCPKPIITVEGAGETIEMAKEYYRSEKIAVTAEMEVPCSLVFNKLKQWTVAKVDDKTGETLQILTIENILPSWNRSTLLFKSTFLDFGLWKLQYYVTLWEKGTEKPELPYQVVVICYIKVLRSPLIAIMVPGSVSRVVRGWSQRVHLDPGMQSIDPDFPDDKSFEYEWYCRQVTENFTMNGTEVVSGPKQKVLSLGDPRPTTNDGGCFGLGPGALDYSDGTWDIDTSILHPRDDDITFELMVVIKKNGRTADTFIHLEMVSGRPPTVGITCADSLLCFPDPDGVLVNPDVRLALRGECAVDCFLPLTYEWKIFQVVDGISLPIEDVADYILSPPGSYELALSTSLFGNYSTVEKFHVSLASNNSHESQKTGAATLYIRINKPPSVKDSNCRTETMGNLALVDKLIVTCQMPRDPDGHAITKFEFRTITVSPTTGMERRKTVITTKKPSITLRVPFGEVALYYDASDEYGGTATKHVATFSTEMPTSEQYNDIMGGPVFLEASSSGDVKALAMIMQASETIRESAYWLAPGYIPPGMDASDMAQLISHQNSAALYGMSNLAMEGKGSLDMAASTLESVFGTSVGSPEKSLQVDSASLALSMDCTDSMIDALDDVDIASPDGLAGAYAGIGCVVGLAVTNAATIAEDENCTSVPAADLRNAPNLHYDARIGDYDGETVIPDVEKQMACNVRDNSMAMAGENAGRLDRTVKAMHKIAGKKQVIGEQLVVKSSSGLVVKTSKMENITGQELTTGDSGGGVKTGQHFNPLGNDGGAVAVAVTEYPTNTRSSSEGSRSLSKDSKVISFEIKTANMTDVEVSNLTEPLLLTIPRAVRNMSAPGEDCAKCLPGPSLINTSTALQNKTVPLIYSQFFITRSDSAFNIEIYPVNDSTHRLFVMVSIGRQPTLKKHEFFKMVKDFPVRISPPDNNVAAEAKYDWFFNSDIVNNRTGRAFVAVGELKHSLDVEETKQILDTKEIVEGAKAKNFLNTIIGAQYLIRTYVSNCYYFDDEGNKWTSHGLRCVGATDTYVQCESTHLTMFGSGFIVEPNTIDFAYVFANASFADNLTIYMTMIVSLTLFFILAIWARWQDKKDVEKLGARPLPDNTSTDKYLYEIMVFTGHKSSAATNSTVSIIISGDKDETPIRTFGEPKRQFFRKGGEDAFVMACPRPLGDLQYLRVWHDNTGRGRYASWYLQYIHIRDVQTGKHYDFVGDRWWALEEGDGQIDRLLPVAGKEQLGEFSHLFTHTSQKNLSDGHLWFSVFLRPPRSRFTRVQRVSSCFALLFLSMMVNAMWYGVVPSSPSVGAINFGPMSLSPEQISVGVMSNLIVFPPSFLIVFLFRKARARTLRKSRIDDALEKQSFGNQLLKSDRPDSVEGKVNKDDKEKKKGKKKKFTLPWWCSLIAWFLCAICLFGSAFIVWSYGVKFGNEKTTKWLTSLLMCFFSSVLLIQPIKVFLVATLISTIFKNIDLAGDDADEDERDPMLADDEEWIYNKPPRKTRGTYERVPTIKYDDITLEKMRKGRLNEVQMWDVIRELVSYGLFLWILVILSFDNRDPNSFFMKFNMEATFVKKGDMTNWKNVLDFSKVHNAGTFWTWTQNVVMAELRAQRWYDNVSPPYGLRGFLDDRVNRIMGYGIIRQIRTKPDTCTIHKSFSTNITKCASFTGIIHEEDDHFCANWTRLGSAQDCALPEYRYRSVRELKSLPYIGTLDVYGGGGYVIKLTGRMNSILKRLKQLEQELWIDHMTRAVMLEFSVYNAQVNLFGIATIFVEMVPGGGMLPGWRFDGMRLIRHQAGFQLFVLICEISYIGFIIYFMVREIRALCKEKKSYFNTYWVYAEWSIILLSWTAVVVYILRYIETDVVLETFKKTYGNGYIRMQYAQSLDDLFGYLLGMLVFVATIKFSKLLRFNRRIGMLSATLKQCWGDLTGFFVIFFIALAAFAMVFNLLLITAMADFKSVFFAVESAFAMLLNKFDFDAMYKSSLLAVILFLTFAVVMTIFFVNVLLTIIIRAFQQVKDDVLSQPNDFEIIEFVSARMLRFLGIGAGGRRVVPLRTQMKEFQEEQRRQEQQGNSVDELPDKMDRFLNQVNDMYFDGRLELNNKAFLMKTLQAQQEREQANAFRLSANQKKKHRPRSNDNDRSNMNQFQAELDDV